MVSNAAIDAIEPIDQRKAVLYRKGKSELKRFKQGKEESYNIVQVESGGTLIIPIRAPMLFRERIFLFSSFEFYETSMAEHNG